MFKPTDTVKVVNYDGPINGLVGVVVDDDIDPLFVRVMFELDVRPPNPTWPTGAYPFLESELEKVPTSNHEE
jgi:hypothetical protein